MEKINLDIKKVLFRLAQEKIQLQVQEINDQLAKLLAAGTEEGKSSAGDKYETQREMIKQSRDILDVQLSRSHLMGRQLERIPIQAMDQVQEGALIKLFMGWVWISISLGKVVHEGNEYQLISKDSPIFLAIKGLKSGDRALFRGRELVIEKLV